MDMTVCIAAIHNDNGIVAASDKMLSGLDAAFEPTISKKVFQVASSIITMCAGDTALQAEIMQSVSVQIGSLEKDKKITVKGITDVYEDVYNQIRIRRIRNDVFAPFGLDENTFVSKQKEMSEIFVRTLAEKVMNFQMPGVETIVAGIDKSAGDTISPHIYCIRKSPYQSSVDCCDAVGYATIGIGSRHVESQFMLARFHRHFSLPKALFLTFLAKKRSEIALGVGKETDMFLVGPTLALCTSLHTTLDYKKLDAMYEDIIMNEKIAANLAFEEMAKLLNGKLPFNPSKFD